MDNYNVMEIQLEASKRHEQMCQNRDAMFERDDHLPDVKVISEIETFETQKGKMLRFLAECQDCGRSGVMEIPDISEYKNSVQINKKKSYPKAGNINVESKYSR